MYHDIQWTLTFVLLTPDTMLIITFVKSPPLAEMTSLQERVMSSRLGAGVKTVFNRFGAY